MKNDIEWLKKRELIENIKSLAREVSQRWPHEEMVELRDVLREVSQLDEPEVLSQEWIDEHKYFPEEKIGEDAVVKARDLRNLIIPKQELRVIPKYVTDWLEGLRNKTSP